MNKKQSLWMAVSYIFFIVLSFGALKFNLISFGPHQFGIWLMLSALWGFGGALDMGIGFSMIKFISEHQNSDENRLRGIISSSTVLLFVLCVIVYMVLYFTGSYYYLNNTSIISNENERILFGRIFNLLSIFFVLRYFNSFFKGVFEGFNRYVYTSKLDSFQSLLVFINAWLTWWLQEDILFLVKMNLFSVMLLFCINLWFLIRDYRGLLNCKYVKIRYIRELFSYSISIQLMNAFGSLVDPAIKYVIGNYYKVDAVSLYEIARKFATSISGLFTSVYRNRLNEVTVIKQKIEQETYLQKSCMNVSKMSVVYSSLFLGFGSAFILVLINLFFKYPNLGKIYMVLALCEAVNIFVYPVYVFLAGAGKAIWLAFIQFLNVIVTIFFLWLGFKLQSDWGGVTGLLVSLIILNSLTFYYVKRSFNLRIRAYLMDSRIVKLALMFVIMLICLVLDSDYLLLATFIGGSLLLLSNLRDVKQLVLPFYYKFARRSLFGES